jgi:hypothetical protein
MIFIPDWILRHSPPRFVALAYACPVCAWAALAVELLALLFFAKYIWELARGYQIPTHLRKKPPVATRGRAVDGLLWLPALVLATWVPGYRGVIALLGDTVFIAFASVVCLEWYVWWEYPKWAGKIVELVVMALFFWLAWRIAQVVPASLRWYTFVVSTTASVIVLLNALLRGLTRRIVLRNVLPPLVLTALFFPSSQLPAVPTWLLCVSLGDLFAWFGVTVGGFWLTMPDAVARRVAPVWIMLQFVLCGLGVPGFRE